MMANTTQPGELRIMPVPLSEEIRPGDSLAEKLLQALRRSSMKEVETRIGMALVR